MKNQFKHSENLTDTEMRMISGGTGETESEDYNTEEAEGEYQTTLSNIMKTKHDTAKNAINNVR